MTSWPIEGLPFWLALRTHLARDQCGGLGQQQAPAKQLPAWYVARHLWRDRTYPTFASRQEELLHPQPIHGDLH
ncbi:hypothetical protein [Sphaerisporangium sp. NPDC051011]|uniref:hypothetical protein n=1 Tax=Sphaerisporangium sp. NPDC051011 TaxID=3155792 RepID=UPI0033FE38F4